MRVCTQVLLAGLVILLAWLLFNIYYVITFDVTQPSTDQLIEAAGYPSEVHKIQTEDGYILTVFRIPHGRHQKPGPRPVFFLQHGLTGSSDQFVHLGPNRALSFLLAEKGYDVWIGNIRGNRYNQENIHFNSSDPKFWDFSWDEMGTHDLPAVITYILNKTKEKKISYAGHSMGTAMMMVLLITRPEYQEKIELVFALAPAVFVGHSLSVVFTFFCQYFGPFILNRFGPSPFLPTNFANFQNWFWPKCSPEHQMNGLCEFLYTLNSGPSSEFDPAMLPKSLSSDPSQTSVKAFAHFGQSIETGKFQAFDYGEEGNIKKYGSPLSPIYDLAKIKTPVVIMFSDNDYIVPPYDEYLLCLALPNVIEYYRVPLSTFNHMDFLYGRSAQELVYDKIFNILKDGPKGKAVCYNDTSQ